MKCKHCGKDNTKYPIRDEEGNFLWKNLFKMDMVNLILTIGIVLLVLGTKVLLDETAEIQKHPCKFCEDNGCCSQPRYCYPDYKPTNFSHITSDFDLVYS